MIYKYQKGLERNYTVVNWDQRNTGKTYQLNEEKEDSSKTSVTIEQFISDIYEAVNMLKNKYNRDIIMM